MLELLTQSQINSPYGEVVVQNVAVPTSTATVRSRYGDAVLSENQAVDWIVPEGVFYISAVAIGAGGSGEGSNVTNAGSGGGAGGLAYISDYFVRPGDTLRIYVGAKGYNITDGAAGGRGDGASGIRHNGSVILLASTGGGGAALNAEGEGGGGIIGDGLFRGGRGRCRRRKCWRIVVVMPRVIILTVRTVAQGEQQQQVGLARVHMDTVELGNITVVISVKLLMVELAAIGAAVAAVLTMRHLLALIMMAEMVVRVSFE